VVGDIKLQLKTIVNTYIGTSKKGPTNPEQWQAIDQYAQHNGYKVAAFITLFGARKKYQQNLFQEIAKKAAEGGIVVFVVSILPDAGFK
jgi:predicted SnoaL-like aldol condensation-catalyzing enzyme